MFDITKYFQKRGILSKPVFSGIIVTKGAEAANTAEPGEESCKAIRTLREFP
jgi:hypothetical protein